MDEVVRLLGGSLKPPSSYILAAIALGMTLLPRIAEARQHWREMRADRWQLQLARERLELEKLRVEIEVMRKTHGIEPSPSFEQDRITHEHLLKTATRSISAIEMPSWIGALVHSRPAAGRLLLSLTQALCMIVSAGCAGLALLASLGTLIDYDPAAVQGILIADVFLVSLAWLLYAQYRRVRRWRHELLPAPAAVAPIES